MSFQSLIDGVDTLCIATFGVVANGGSVTHIPQGGNPLSIDGIFKEPSLMEEIMPGTGVNVARFFVRSADLTVQPKKGDALVINGTQYSIFDVDADLEGSATLKLRKN